MREWNALRSYPQPDHRLIGGRNIWDRIIASYRGVDFFDGPRAMGYGGLVDDGRWGPVAEDIIKDYKPSKVLELECEKGFLLKALKDLGVDVLGVESSKYARSKCVVPVSPRPPEECNYDLVIARGLVYCQSLKEAMNTIRFIERLAHKAFITLAAYDTEEDLRLLRKWTLLGTTILRKDEWVEVLKHCGYTGDYWFTTAKSLKLVETWDPRSSSPEHQEVWEYLP